MRDSESLHALLALSCVDLGIEANAKWEDAVIAELGDEGTRAEFFRIAFKQRLLPNIARVLLQQGPQWVREMRVLSTLSNAISAINRRQLQAVEEISLAFAEQGIAVRWIKGVDILCRAHPLDLPRIMFDLDVLVSPPQLTQAKEVLRSLGFQQGEYDPLTRQIRCYSEDQVATIEQSHYETAPAIKLLECPELIEYHSDCGRYVSQKLWTLIAGRSYLTLEIDLHFNLAPDLDLDDIWGDGGSCKLSLPSGSVIDVCDVTVALWFHASRGYQETFQVNQPRLRHLFDVVLLVKQCSHAINWDELIRVCFKYTLHASLYYPLYHTSKILPAHISESVLRELMPSKARWAGDLGDYLPRLLNRVGCSNLLDAIVPNPTRKSTGI